MNLRLFAPVKARSPTFTMGEGGPLCFRIEGHRLFASTFVSHPLPVLCKEIPLFPGHEILRDFGQGPALGRSAVTITNRLRTHGSPQLPLA
jgi:hypothetical protein